ncbi:universal stress protein [Nitrosopumilus sp.]|uniref:universal stress protein n=1 Tax=Nitrosopumilus sp. TaxID=2024843 RepID=UPI00247BBFE2|nr:universal stress protein [Nitrosopumilus sp.]MCV0411091.1 universal stress protein [Nitrosopumilus sp.]
MKNILVPYDFTNFADAALKKAIEIAKKFDSKITLFNVIGSNTDTTGMSWSRAQEVHDEVEKQVTNDLNKIKESIKDTDISVEIRHNPSTIDGILSFADTDKIDLIVMGSHGRSGFKKLVLGSVASGVIAKANCSVFIAKSPK